MTQTITRWRMLQAVAVATLAAFLSGDLVAQSGCTGGPVNWNATATLAALAQCTVNADDGDHIIVAAGTVDFTSPIFITNKAMTIRGQGPGQTIFRDMQTGAGAGHMFQVQTKNTGGSPAGLFAIRDVTVEENTGGQGGMIKVSGSTRNLWFDNIVWEYRRAAQTIHLVGDVRGVLSRLDVRIRSFGAFIYIEHQNWDGIGSFGDNSWAVAPTMGTAAAVYIEDSKFQCIGLGYCATGDSDSGARLAIRFSEFINPQFVQHGMGTGGRDRSGAQTEFYHNYVHDYEQGASHNVYPFNGGWGVTFNNVATLINTPTITAVATNRSIFVDAIAKHEPYAFGDCAIRAITEITCSGGVATISASQMSGVAGMWIQIQGNSVGAYNGTFAITAPTSIGFVHLNPAGSPIKFAAACGGTGTGGTMQSPFDGNSNSPAGNGYYCTDGIGRGPGRLFAGGSANNTYGTGVFLTDTSPSAQILLPIYQWGETVDGNARGIQQHWANDSNDIATNRDYFTQVGASCTGGGSCTTGVGVGTTLPTTCEANVGGVAGAAVAFYKSNEGTWNQETAALHATHLGNTHTLNQQGRLYRCGGPAGPTGQAGTTDNSWVLFYEPYTYPHPLRTGGGAPNSTPVVTINSPVSNFNTTATTINLSGTCSDDVACTSLTWVNSNGGATTPLAVLDGQNWTITGAALNNGVNTFTVTGGDGTLTGQATVSVLKRAAVSSLPFTDDCSSSIAWPTLGPLYTLYGSFAAYAGMESGTCKVNTAGAFDTYGFTGFTLQSDHYIEAKIVTVSSGAQQLRLCVNASGSTGQNSNMNAYFVQVDGTNSPYNMIGRYTGGALDHVYVSNIPGITVVPGTTVVEARKSGTNLTLLVDGVEKHTENVGSAFSGGTAGPCPVGLGTAWDDVEIGNTAPGADTQSPVFTITTPTTSPTYDGENNTTLATFGGTWTDNVGVVTCFYSNSLVPGNVAMTVGGGTCTVSSVPLVIGNNVLTVTALDAAGNMGTAALTVFRTPPPEPGIRPRRIRGIRTEK